MIDGEPSITVHTILSDHYMHAGLKPAQRRVMFTCFKRNDKSEVKRVTQLARSVTELHHEEVSDWSKFTYAHTNKGLWTTSIHVNT